jgi:adenosine kinase
MSKRKSNDPSDLAGILLGMGNPLLDISADVEMSMVEKYGLKMGDAAMVSRMKMVNQQHACLHAPVTQVDENNQDKLLPLYKDLVDNCDVQYIAGGATQNSIRVAQWMLPGDVSATSYMGCVGNDKFGEELASAAKADGVHVHYSVDAEAATGTCAVLVNGGERSLCANLAAANNYKVDHLKESEGQTIMNKAQFYYSSGFFLTVSPDSMTLVGEHAAAENKVYTMNLAAPFLIDVPFFYDRMVTMIPYCDYIFCNESEAACFGKKNEWGEDLKVVATKLAAWDKKNSKRPRTVVFTQGSECTLVAFKGEVKEYPVDLLPKESLVDTNGAGTDSLLSHYYSYHLIIIIIGVQVMHLSADF